MYAIYSYDLIKVNKFGGACKTHHKGQ